MAQPTRKQLDIAIVVLEHVADNFLYPYATLTTTLGGYFPDTERTELQLALDSVRKMLTSWTKAG